MRRLGTVGVCVFAVVFKAFDGVVETCLGKANVLADLGKISDLERGSVFTNDVHERNIVEHKFVISYFKLSLWELEGLFNQLAIALHLPWPLMNLARIALIAR